GAGSIGGARGGAPGCWRGGGGPGGARGGEAVRDRVRAARGEGSTAVHGLRAGGSGGAGDAGEAPDGGQRGLLLAPAGGRGRGGGNRASGGWARAGRGELGPEGGLGGPGSP